MITHATVLRKFLGSIRSLLVVYNAEEQDYFIKGVMGSTTLVQPKMEVSDSNTTANPSSNKVRIVRFNEDDFCTNFLGGVPWNKICGLMEVDNGSCKKYNTHTDREKGGVDSTLYLT